MPTSHRRFKDAIYEQFARIGKAVSAPKRVELLDLLSQGPRSVEALANETAMTVANTSRHLQVLRAARLVQAVKRGLHVEYSLAAVDVGDFLLAVRRIAEAHLAEVQQVARSYLDPDGTMEGVESEELLRRVRRGEVTVVDVRPAEEFRAGHLPGALSIPLDELEACLRGLPRDREIVAYCRGPYCVMAADAVKLLRKRGFKAHRLEQGVVDWRARGWRVESARQGARR
jgi:rhodanese-related sulfurtransferase